MVPLKDRSVGSTSPPLQSITGGKGVLTSKAGHVVHETLAGLGCTLNLLVKHPQGTSGNQPPGGERKINFEEDLPHGIWQDSQGEGDLIETHQTEGATLPGEGGSRRSARGLYPLW